MKTLAARLDVALERAGESRQGLAKAIGYTRQSLYPTGDMASHKVAQIARHLRCCPVWLATGEGGKYKPADHVVTAIVEKLEAMTPEERIRVLSVVTLCARGDWPDVS